MKERACGHRTARPAGTSFAQNGLYTLRRTRLRIRRNRNQIGNKFQSPLFGEDVLNYRTVADFTFKNRRGRVFWLLDPTLVQHSRLWSPNPSQACFSTRDQQGRGRDVGVDAPLENVYPIFLRYVSLHVFVQSDVLPHRSSMNPDFKSRDNVWIWWRRQGEKGVWRVSVCAKGKQAVRNLLCWSDGTVCKVKRAIESWTGCWMQ